MASELELMALAAIAQFAVPVSVAPATASGAGTATSGTTETMDTVLGTYQVSLIAGRRYAAIMNGLTGNAGVANDIYLCNIRNSGSTSTPTASSTLVAQQQWSSTTSGTPSRNGIPLAGTFIAPTTGLNTFAFFAQRISGTGAFTPVSGNTYQRELYVAYCGIV